MFDSDHGLGSGKTIPRYPEGSFERDGILYCPCIGYTLTYYILSTSIGGRMYVYRSTIWDPEE